MADKFETHLSIVKHMSKMLLEMADVDFDKISPEDEKAMLEDYEEVASHLLDSLSFEITDISDDGQISARIKPVDPEEYIKNFSENN